MTLKARSLGSPCDHRRVSQVQFAYRLTGAGWAEADLRIGAQSVRLTASYLGDALGDLLRGTLALARGSSQVEVSWAEEPGEFQWMLSVREHDSLDVRIVRLRLRAEEAPPGMAHDPGVEILAETCDRQEFVSAITDGARETLDAYGLEGYRERWDQFDFPSATLAELVALG
jgi:hypothetical protein